MAALNHYMPIKDNINYAYLMLDNGDDTFQKRILQECKKSDRVVDRSSAVIANDNGDNNEKQPPAKRRRVMER
ncbi:MAG: hypothetical protein AAF153_02500 [Pseudomonadota bacterium]